MESVARPPVAVSVPVKFAFDDIFWPLMRPDDIVPVATRFARERSPEKRVLP